MNPNAKSEHFEWVNMWHDHTKLPPEKSRLAKRLLFVGDSITNGMRAFLPAQIREIAGVSDPTEICVDFMVTSKGIDNPDIIRELEYMTSGYKYDFIHFNNCLHGFSADEQSYELCYEEVVLFLLKKVPPERMVLMLGTPLSVKDDPTQYGDMNLRVCARNEAVKRIAARHSLAVNNLYTTVFGKPELRTSDGYHYTSDGYELLAETTAEFIMPYIF